MNIFPVLKKGRGLLIVLGLTVFIIGIFTALSTPTLAQSTGVSQIKGGIDSIAGTTGLNIGGSSASPDSALALVASFVNVLLSFLGVAFLLLILYAGGIWMFALGDGKKVDKARQIIKTASLGLAVIILSFFIVNLVLNILGQVTGGGSKGSTTCSVQGTTCTPSDPNKCNKDPKCSCIQVVMSHYCQ